MERLPGTGTILAGGLYGLPAVLGRPARPTHHHWHLRLRAGTPGFSCGDGCHCCRPALAPGDYQWEDDCHQQFERMVRAEKKMRREKCHEELDKHRQQVSRSVYVNKGIRHRIPLFTA